MTRLAGKVAVVTGGASGIGLATVERFVEEGARVVFCDLHDGEAPSRGEDIERALGKERAIFVPCDVTDRGQLAKVIETATIAFGGLDVLFNNAGIAGGEGSILKCSEDRFERIIAVDLKAAWLGIKLATPAISTRGGGSIITTSSISAHLGMPGQGAYASAKSGVVGLTRVAATELARRNIRVNCVCPGAIATPMYFQPELGGPDASLDDVRVMLTGGQPLPRAGEARDVANAVLWLASDESSFVTGQFLNVDGGRTAEFSRSQGSR